MDNDQKLFIYLLWFLYKAPLWKAVAWATYWKFGMDPARKRFSLRCAEMDATESEKTVLVLAVQEQRSMDWVIYEHWASQL